MKTDILLKRLREIRVSQCTMAGHPEMAAHALLNNLILDLATELEKDWESCPNCNGTGVYETQTCSFCDGEKRVHKSVFGY